MAYFVVYSTASGTTTQRSVLRWGECPTESVSVQASSSGEVALEVTALGGLSTASSATGWVVNPSTGALTYLSSPYTPSPAEYEAAEFEDRTTLTAALRASDWAVLSDAPLTTAQKAEWVTYRANLRAWADDANFGNPAGATALPTPPTSTEF